MSTHAHVVARLADFPDGTMRQVDIDGAQILLVRRGADVFAMDGICPHAGAPLADGVLVGSRIVCPWHKAAFCAKTGACLDPPAVDDLKHFPVGIRDGEVLVELEAPVHPAPVLPATQDPRRFLIVGGGAAGAAAVQTLRAAGFAGYILLIDREGALPYDRTILSKAVLSGGEASEKTPLQSEKFYVDHGIERLTAEVTALNAASRTLLLSDGTEHAYDAVLVASGGEPIRLEIPGVDLANVLLLRSRADAERILAVAATARKAVVIGASFIGMEVAASLRERGLKVTVVAEDREPFARVLGPAVGAVFRRMHEKQGVSFRLGRRIARLVGNDVVARVVLADGEVLDADLVICGLGVRPATGFMGQLGLRQDGGLTVDRALRVADGIYAAGDVAAFPLYGDGPATRIEHWRVAQQQGRVAALNMMGDERAYDAVPYFWTIQYQTQFDYVGHATGADEVTVRGSLEQAAFIAYYRRDGRVLAAIGRGRERDMAALTHLLGEGRAWTLDEIHPAASSPAAVLGALELARSS